MNYVQFNIIIDHDSVWLGIYLEQEHFTLNSFSSERKTQTSLILFSPLVHKIVYSLHKHTSSF